MDIFKNKKNIYIAAWIFAAALVLILAFINFPKYRSVTVEGVRYSYDLNNKVWYVEKAVDRSIERVSIQKEILDLPVTQINANAFKNCEKLEKVKIPDSIKSIEGRAFYNCSALETVNLPEDISVLEEGLFYGCSSLKEISIPDDVEIIESNAFYNCSALKSMNIPDGVERIENNAFYNCSALNSINIPDSVKIIGDSVFGKCKDLSSVHIPDDLIRRGMFESSKSISIELSEKTTAINGYTFSNWTNLRSITIPEGVTQIASKAFTGCTALESVRIPKSVEKIYLNTFSDCGSDLVVQVPSNTKIVDEAGTTYNPSYFYNSTTSAIEDLIYSAVGVRQYDYSWVKRMKTYS